MSSVKVEISEANTDKWETLCQQSRQQLRRGAALQRRLRGALQHLKYLSNLISDDEAMELHLLLKALSEELVAFCQLPEAAPTRAGVAEPLLHRGDALHSELAKTRLTVSYLGHQLAGVALKSLANCRFECHEPLAVGVCVLARELGSLVIGEPGGDGAGVDGTGESGAQRQLLLYRNTCPSLLFPARRLTLTRLLQLTASHRAEAASCSLLASLLSAAPANVRATDAEESHATAKTGDPSSDSILVRGRSICSASSSPIPGSSSGNSSFEVCRELLRFASPPLMVPVERSGLAALLSGCLAAELRLPASLLSAARTDAPQLAGPLGATLLAQRESRSKVLTYYRQLLWGDAGGLADHVLLWWLRPLGALWSARAVLHWLRRELRYMPEDPRSAVATLCEALASHNATVTWDALFRRTLVTPSGHCYAALLHSLVGQVQVAERGPAVEQIPLLHRLDHSLHTYRLWVLAAARTHIGAWRVADFVQTSQTDVSDSCMDMTRLMISDVYTAPPLDCVHETVCAKMRCKLVSEVKTNLSKLQCSPEECIQVMAAVCRTVSLAHLHMCFPERYYWRQDGNLPQFASPYVEEYLDRVMRPVLAAVTNRPIEAQQKISGMALRIVCEAWLDHIYQLRVQFSEWGALQLLADFGAVPTWLQERASLSAAMERHLVRSEVLRRCEGVGRLLLRRPGEALDLTSSGSRRRADTDSTPATPVKDSMPAEMYVPNQEKWLELRARRRGPALSVASALLCCR